MDGDGVKDVNSHGGTSLVVQWLRLHASTAGGVGSLPRWRTKIPHVWCGQKKSSTKNRFGDGMETGVVLGMGPRERWGGLKVDPWPAGLS